MLVNNKAGEKALGQVKNQLNWKQTKLEDSLQPPLKAPFSQPENRAQFWNDFRSKAFDYMARKYSGYGLENNIKAILRRLKRKIKKLVVKGGKRNTSII